METLNAAWGLMTGFDPALTAIVGLSLHVNLSAVFFGFIIGAALAIWDFRGKQVLVAISNAMMVLPLRHDYHDLMQAQ